MRRAQRDDVLRNLIEMWESTARACEKRSPSYDHVLATAATVFRTCAHDLRDGLQRMQESEGNVKSESDALRWGQGLAMNDKCWACASSGFYVPVGGISKHGWCINTRCTLFNEGAVWRMLAYQRSREGNVKSEQISPAFIVRIGVEDRELLIRLLRAAYKDAVLEADHRRAFQLLVTLGDPEATQGAFSDRG
jgi:hypothetical protein